jgi:hypothetical protein
MSEPIHAATCSEYRTALGACARTVRRSCGPGGAHARQHRAAEDALTVLLDAVHHVQRGLRGGVLVAGALEATVQDDAAARGGPHERVLQHRVPAGDLVARTHRVGAGILAAERGQQHGPGGFRVVGRGGTLRGARAGHAFRGGLARGAAAGLGPGTHAAGHAFGANVPVDLVAGVHQA